MSNSLTAATAAEELTVSKRRVLALIASGAITADRVGNLYLITREELDRVKAIERKPGNPWKAKR